MEADKCRTRRHRTVSGSGLTGLISVLAVSLTAVPCRAADVDEAKLQRAEQLFHEGNVAASSHEFPKAIELYHQGLITLGESTTAATTTELPKVLQDRYAQVSLTLTRNYILAHFQAGQFLAKAGSEKLTRAVQSAQAMPDLVHEASRQLQESAQYLDLTLQLLDKLEASYRTVLDTEFRFVGPWPAEPSDNKGPIGFSDYYHGGCYLNLAVIAAYLGDVPEEQEYTKKMHALGQPELEAVYHQIRQEVDPLLSKLYGTQGT